MPSTVTDPQSPVYTAGDTTDHGHAFSCLWITVWHKGKEERERESEMYVTHDNFMRAAVFILKYLCQEEKINTHTVYIYFISTDLCT